MHISSAIVTEIAKEFSLDDFENMETEVLNNLQDSEANKNAIIIDSLGPVEAETMEEDTNSTAGELVNVIKKRI